MNIKRWLYNLKHLNLLENNFAKKIENIDVEQKRLVSNLVLQLNSMQENNEWTFSSLMQENDKWKNSILKLKNTVYSLKSKLKKLIVPIKVIFLCEQQALWKSFSSLVDILLQDNRFEVIVINMWCKDYSNDGSYSYINPHIEKMCKNKNVRILDSYDVKNDHWVDLKKLAPDYVFFNRPYDYYRNENYHIQNVAKYSRPCYIPYGMRIIGGDVEKFTHPKDFCSQLYFFFVGDSLAKISLKKATPSLSNLDDSHLLYVGYPGLDILRNKLNEVNSYNHKKFNILWLPRWNTSEGNCNFFNYKDVLLQYVKRHKDCCLTFRPHPMCFSNFIKTEEMSQEELKDFKNNFINSDVADIDESGDYIGAFLKSDVLVADETSLIAEYFVTEKPVVFCKKVTHFSTLMEALVEGIYVVNNKDELIDTLNFLLVGNDPLKDKRKQIIDKYLLNYGESAAENIKNILMSEISKEI